MGQILVIKKYGNRRLYDTEASSYITLDDLSKLIKAGRDVQVVDAKSGQDLTKTVLLQIITEQEKDRDLLPVSFLKKMIELGDSSLRESLQRYLSLSLESFLNTQKEFEQQYRKVAGNFLNPMMWMMPQFAHLTGLSSDGNPAPAEPPPPSADPPAEATPAEAPPAEATPSKEDQDRSSTKTQIAALKNQVDQIQKLLARLGKGD